MDHCVSIFSFSENRSSVKKKYLTVCYNHTHLTRSYSATSECRDREAGRPHGKSPPTGKKEHAGCGTPITVRCSLPRWLWSLIPLRPGMQSLCWCFLTIVRTRSTPESTGTNNASQVYNHGFPVLFAKTFEGPNTL